VSDTRSVVHDALRDCVRMEDADGTSRKPLSKPVAESGSTTGPVDGPPVPGSELCQTAARDRMSGGHRRSS
jgi:hypothetical protein